MIAATLLAAVLRLVRLGGQSLWIDEIFTWYSADIGGRFGPRELIENVHGPLFSLIVHAFGAVFGDSERVMRLPSALAGIATVPALVWLADRWLGRRVAMWAAPLAAGSPFLVWYSQEARNYSLLMLCVCVSSAALLAVRERPRARGAVLYLGVVWAGLLSNFAFALVLPLHLLWWLKPLENRGRRLANAAAALTALTLLVSPWALQSLHIWDYQRLDPGRRAEQGETPLRGGTTFHGAAVPFALHAFAVGYTLGPSLRELRTSPSPQTLERHAPELAATGLIFGILAVLGIAGFRRRGRFGEAVLWLALPAAVVTWFALSNFKAFHPRYLAASFPAFLLTVATALADLRAGRRVVLALAVAGLWGASLFHHYADPRYGKEDCRGAARLIASRAAAGEAVLAVNTQDPLIYYYRGPLEVIPFWLGYARDPVVLAHKLDQMVAGRSGLWVVLSRPEDLDPQGEFVRQMESRFPDAERFAREGVRVWHVRGEAAASVGTPAAS